MLIDLFSGCGGLSRGFVDSGGYEVLIGLDNWKDALDTFQYNHPDSIVELADLSKYNPIDLLKYDIEPGRVDIIVGGPPCQGFSIAGNKFGFECDERNFLYLELVRFLKEFKPAQFIMENVPPILEYKSRIIRGFNEAGYKVSVEKINGLEIGSKQKRIRVFFIGELK